MINNIIGDIVSVMYDPREGFLPVWWHNVYRTGSTRHPEESSAMVLLAKKFLKLFSYFHLDYFELYAMFLICLKLFSC